MFLLFRYLQAWQVRRPYIEGIPKDISSFLFVNRPFKSSFDVLNRPCSYDVQSCSGSGSSKYFSIISFLIYILPSFNDPVIRHLQASFRKQLPVNGALRLWLQCPQSAQSDGLYRASPKRSLHVPKDPLWNTYPTAVYRLEFHRG